jgi:hypothetical protein
MGNLKKHSASDNRYTLDELMHNVCETITSTVVSEIKLVLNIKSRIEAF